MQNVINMFTAPLYTYLVDLNISWTYILPYYTIPLLERTILLTKHLNLGVLFVQFTLSSTGLSVIKFPGPCTGEEERQNKIKFRTGQRSLETAHCHGLCEDY